MLNLVVVTAKLYPNLAVCRFRYCQSLSSNWNISSNFFPNTWAIFIARTVDGTYFPCSIALMVCRLTCTNSANCCWVMRLMALSTRILVRGLGNKNEIGCKTILQKIRSI